MKRGWGVGGGVHIWGAFNQNQKSIFKQAGSIYQNTFCI